MVQKQPLPSPLSPPAIVTDTSLSSYHHRCLTLILPPPPPHSLPATIASSSFPPPPPTPPHNNHWSSTGNKGCYRVGDLLHRPSSGFNGNNGFKKPKQDMESFQSGLGSKSKPCTKFFSTSGCPFGEGCHFSHYVPGGVKNVTQMAGGNPALPPTIRNSAVPPSFPDGSSPPAVKNRLCTKYNTAEGCRFGDKCHFAHGEWELGKPTAPSHHEDPRAMGHAPGSRFGGGGPGRMDFNPAVNHAAAVGFGASATAKISVLGTLAGPIIGKNGVNSKQICRMTGVKLSIREHESDPNLKNIELEGTFEQINQASQMVRELIGNISSTTLPHPPPKSFNGPPANNLKTKLCENFTKGSCTFGERCHFAHGAEELRIAGV